MLQPVIVRLIDRYLVREILPYVVLTLVLMTSVIFLHQANRFSELFIVFTRSGLPTGPLLGLLASILPTILVYTMPIALLVGVLMGLGRLSGDNEITAMRASGISRRHLTWPLLAIGLVAAGLMMWVTFSLAPAAQRVLGQLKETRGDLIYKGLATQVKPRVFEESVPGKVFFVSDIDRRTNEWRNILIADTPGTNEPDDVTIYTARAGRLSSPEPGQLLPEFHLFDAEAHKVSNVEERNRVEYDIVSAERLSIVFNPAPQQDDPNLAPKPPALAEMDFATLTAYTPTAEQKYSYPVEVHRRVAVPVTCLIFAVIGLAFGIHNVRAGRSFGLVVGLVLTTIFYVLTLGGDQSARSGAIPAWLGVWAPNLLFAGIGICAAAVNRLPSWMLAASWTTRRTEQKETESRNVAHDRGRSVGAWRFAASFPRIIDRMLLSDLGLHVAYVIAGLTVIFIVFTVFELVREIVENDVGPAVVLGYVVYLTPQIVTYMTPVAVLVGVMVTFGLMASGSQLVALKASGQSIYRMALPVFCFAILVGAALFAVQNYILPSSNRQQEDLRQQITSGQEPARTIYQMDRQWVFGQENRIFYFRHFDPVANRFAQINVFDLDPATFEIKRRYWASEATWDAGTGSWLLEFGWMRTFAGAEITSAEAFRKRTVTLAETPDYFKRPVSSADKLTLSEIQHEITELSRSGFDVLDLRIDFQRKLAFPFTCLVMALVGLPFALTVGKRGALYGVALGIVIGLVFWGAIGFFAQMGRYEILPPVLAGWGPNVLFGAGGAYLFLTTRT